MRQMWTLLTTIASRLMRSVADVLLCQGEETYVQQLRAVR